jgi:hypothetical protein
MARRPLSTIAATRLKQLDQLEELFWAAYRDGLISYYDFEQGREGIQSLTQAVRNIHDAASPQAARP